MPPMHLSCSPKVIPLMLFLDMESSSPTDLAHYVDIFLEDESYVLYK